jgi:hypothetical protein
MNAQASITPSITPLWFARTELTTSVLSLAGMIHLALVAADLVPLIFVGTALNAILLGASMGAIEKWRTERGVWMLASFFALVAAALFGTFAWWIGRDLLQGTTYSPLMALDATLTLAILAAAAALLAFAARWNWRLTRRGRPPPSKPDAGSPVPAPIRPDQPILTARAQAPIPQ